MLIYIEAEGNFSKLYCEQGYRLQISKPLKDLEEQLVPRGFSRIQKSFLINLRHIVEYSKSEGGYVVKHGYYDIKIPVSKQLREVLDAIIL